MLILCSVDDWLAGFDIRVSPFVNLKITLEEEEVVKLGKKNEDQYPLMLGFPAILLHSVIAVVSSHK